MNKSKGLTKSKRRSQRTIANKENKLLRIERKAERRKPWNQARVVKHAAEVPLRQAARREKLRREQEKQKAKLTGPIDPITNAQILPT